MRITPVVLLLLTIVLSGCLNRPTVVYSGPEVAVMSIRVGKEKEFRRVVIKLDEAAAPLTSANFKELARRGFYDGMRFHRVFPDLLVQTGDPYSRRGDTDRSGTGGPGYTLPAEIRLSHLRGSVAASRLPDNVNPTRASSGSQFYVCLTPMPQLDGDYTVFGRVVEGLEVLDEISKVSTNSNDFPLEKIVIRSITMEPEMTVASVGTPIEE
ncbi:MAG: peptidylprolyl isomerase [Chthoniobacterales bacterium]